MFVFLSKETLKKLLIAKRKSVYFIKTIKVKMWIWLLKINKSPLSHGNEKQI